MSFSSTSLSFVRSFRSWSCSTLTSVFSKPPRVSSSLKSSTLPRLNVRDYTEGSDKVKSFPHFSSNKFGGPYTRALVVVVTVAGSIFYYVLRKRRRKMTKTNTKAGVFLDKCVLITGGAGDIGSSVALTFSSEGAKVVLVDLPQTETILKKKCKALMKAGATSATYITADVTNVEDIKNMVELASDEGRTIDIFFNNAGIQGVLRPIPEQDDDGFRKVIDINIYGVFLGMKYVSKAMKESGKGGVIVNTASLAGLVGPANMAAYAASKFAVVGMTKTAAKDLARHGIRVCAIAPGILEGKMWETQIRGNAECRKHIQGDNSTLTREDIVAQEARMIEGTPMGRLGKMSEVASVVKFLCSDEASYLTGITVPIDGGRLQ